MERLPEREKRARVGEDVGDGLVMVVDDSILILGEGPFISATLL